MTNDEEWLAGIKSQPAYNTNDVIEWAAKAQDLMNLGRLAVRPAGMDLATFNQINGAIDEPFTVGKSEVERAWHSLSLYGLISTGLTDSGLASTLSDSNSASGALFTRKLAESAESGAIPPTLSPSEVIAGILDFQGKSHYRIGLAGHSLWNDGNDPQRKLLLRLAQLSPSGFGLREYPTVPGNPPSYNSPITVRAGENTPDIGGTVLIDNFNRTGELSGSTTSGGQVWAGTPGSWEGDGGAAVVSGSAALAFDTGAKDQTITAVIPVVSTSPSTARQLRIIAAATTTSPTTGGNYLWAQININTSGVVQYSLWKRISGVNTQIGSTVTNPPGLAANSPTPVVVTAVVQTAVQNFSVTFKVTGQSDVVISGTVLETDVSVIGTFAGLSGSNGSSFLKVDSVSLAIPFTPGTYRGLDIYNGSVAGTTLAYQTTYIDDLFPASRPLNAMLVPGGGHNAAALDATTYIATVDAFIQAFRSRHPSTPVGIFTDNPQFSPAVTRENHARNQMALRNYAFEKGFEYFPVFEAFASQPDGGQSLVLAQDGIHPTVSTTTDITTWCGNLLITSLIMRMINSRRRVGVPIQRLF